MALLMALKEMASQNLSENNTINIYNKIKQNHMTKTIKSQNQKQKKQ